MQLTKDDLVGCGLAADEARALLEALAGMTGDETRAARWRRVSRELLTPAHPFALHELLYRRCYEGRSAALGPPPLVFPTEDDLERAHVTALQRELGLGSYEELHAWSVRERSAFWDAMVRRLGIALREPYRTALDSSAGAEHARFLPGASLNIAESCFRGDEDGVAIVEGRPDEPETRTTRGELDRTSDRVARALVAAGFREGDAVAIDAPMHGAVVAIYLGMVKAGITCVSIADSFAPAEIATRLRIAHAKGIVTQDVIRRGGRELPLYEKVRAAGAPRAIVLAAGDAPPVSLRDGDISYDAFLAAGDATGSGAFEAVARGPDAHTNILFSSGTTGDPKAIPWTQTTPIKAAVDGHLHHDIHPGDVVCWPTSLGWMMGPWLIYAALVNRAAIALFDDAPTATPFARFVERAGVTMLGVVPSLVRAWRGADAIKGRDWSRMRCFSSTGECSNASDMHWLMAQAGYRPVVEYCGGTEIGGGYITGTLVRPAVPAAFNTKALGLDLHLLDEDGRPTDSGEVFLVPPSLGLSAELLNRDHHEVYFEGAPKGPRGAVLRRHGDHLERLAGGFFRAHGRVDDTMNLGGIKVSSAEIERVVNRTPGVVETAAIAAEPEGGGPSLLVVYAVTDEGAEPADALRAAMQRAVKDELNPLFKVHEVVPIDALPRTASNKVMRRVLRARYHAGRG